MQEPIFWLWPDVKETEVLLKLSAAHYDSHCRSVGKLGGFLYGMNVIAEFGGSYKAKFGDLDTLLKIMEPPFRLEPDETALVGRMWLDIGSRLKEAQNSAR